MVKSRFIIVITLLMLLPLLAMTLLLTVDVTAQDVDVGTPPVAITPGQSIFGATGIEPTLTFDECYNPLPISIGQVIYIEPGVNIRSGASGSSPIVWNTIYNNRNDEGEVVDNPVNIIATVVEGPVCDTGSNWWRVELPGNDGWVSEGRPFSEGGYLISLGPADPDAGCTSYYDLTPGQLADLFLDARVRTDPSLDARVRTVAAAGTPVLVLGGGDCIDDIRWWFVRVQVVNVIYEGWMAEGSQGRVWLFPRDLPSTANGTLCGNPLTLSIGQRAYVNSLEKVPRNMRLTPGLNSPVMFTLVNGTPFIIVGGPTCVDNINWWQIEVLASDPVTGWMSEGSTGVGWWISTVNPDEFAR